MDLRKIKKLIDLLEESNLAELEIKEGEEVVRLSRVPKNAAPVAAAPVAVAAAPAPIAAAPVAAVEAPAASALPAGHVVKAPMVGTFYASATPGTHGTPAAFIARIASTLSPIRRITSAVGPMKMKPDCSTCSAKSARSDRKP
jgi:hypothetical protein